jgi:hypothetical protein
MPFDGTTYVAPLKTRFVEALRSGNYKQTRGTWKNGASYCAMGVLFELAEPGYTLAHRPELGFLDDTQYYHLTNKVKDALTPMEQSAVMYLNDKSRMSFEEIADIIESGQLLEVYSREKEKLTPRRSASLGDCYFHTGGLIDFNFVEHYATQKMSFGKLWHDELEKATKEILSKWANFQENPCAEVILPKVKTKWITEEPKKEAVLPKELADLLSETVTLNKKALFNSVYGEAKIDVIKSRETNDEKKLDYMPNYMELA